MLCPLCGKKASKKWGQHPGYRKLESYRIFHCHRCCTAFCHPQHVPENLYEKIYENSSQLPGYNRYLHYAEQVLKEKDPLKYLSDAEDVYWAIQHYLDDESLDKKILEIGCGQGYLTYALRCRGFNAIGLDISKRAVDSARKRYGDHYLCEDLIKYSQNNFCKYDTIIMTEVIEHIEDVKAFLKAIDLLLKPGGHLVLTTPNRSLYPVDVLWETEPPPVHLWWFSEKSIAYLAKRLSYRCRFIDFSAYNAEHSLDICDQIRGYHPTRCSRIDENGKVLHQGDFIQYSTPPESARRSRVKAVLKQMQLLPIAARIKQGIQTIGQAIRRRSNRSRRSILCAILQKRES